MRWYRNGEIHRLGQPVGKQYTCGKGSEYESETAKLQAENCYLKQQIEVLKSTKNWKGSSTKGSCKAGREITRNHDS